jgi:hypothetical protein
MSDETPVLLGGYAYVIRNAPAALSGAPIPKMLANPAFNSSGQIAGTSPLEAVPPMLQTASASIPGVSPLRFGQRPSSRSAEFFGRGRVVGKVSIESTPASRKVRLFDALTGILVAELWSAVNGAYAFNQLDARRDYFVLAHDHIRQFNAVVADFVRAALPEDEVTAVVASAGG